MKILKTMLPVLSAVILMVGCASAPKKLDSIETARSQVQSLAADPLAGKVAAKQLQDAREALRQAEETLEKGKTKDADHLAYVASRTAESGLAAVAEERARQAVAQGEAQRNVVRLQSREREAAAATEQAKAAQSEAQRAMEEARAQQQSAEAARAELLKLQQEFADLQAKQTERGMVLTLGDVLFDTGKATLKAGADLTVNRLAKFLTDHADFKVIIEGHTDSVGSSEYNQGLSERRARAVGDSLSGHGIASPRYEVRGRGEDYPVASNDSASGRQQNRRVEIVFSEPSGQFKQQ